MGALVKGRAGTSEKHRRLTGNSSAHGREYAPTFPLAGFDSHPVPGCPAPTPSRFPEYASHGSLLDVLRGVGRSGGLTWVRRLSMALDAAKVRRLPPGMARGPISGTLLARCVGRAAALAGWKGLRICGVRPLVPAAAAARRGRDFPC